ncbi:hypothetical protein ACFL35_08295 [Candidatus Riflebacteria bacterium]
MDKIPVYTFFLFLAIFFASSPLEARIYKRGKYIFDINCINKQFDYINPETYHLKLRFWGSDMYVRAFVEGYQVKNFQFKLIKDKYNYEFTLQLPDPVIRVWATDVWGNQIIDANINLDQGLGYGGDHFGIICYVPVKTFTDLNQEQIHLSRDFGPKFTRYKLEIKKEGEFHRLKIEVRRVQLWDDYNEIYVVFEKAGAGINSLLQFPGSMKNPPPPEIEQLFNFAEQVQLIKRWQRAVSLKDFRELKQAIKSRFKTLDEDIQQESHRLFFDVPSKPSENFKLKSHLKNLQSDLRNLKRLFGVPPFSRF